MLERATLARVAPFFAYIFFIVLTDVAGRLGWSAEQLRWLYPLKIGVVLVLLLVYRRAYTELRAPLRAGAAALAVLAGVVVLVLWLNLDAGWMQVGSPAGFDPRSHGAMDWPLTLIRLAGAALVVPIMEELFWRAFLLRWLSDPAFLAVSPHKIKPWAVIVTVILFGFEHTLWLAGIVAGLSYSLLYMRSGNLWSPILAHMVTNGLLGLWIIHTGQWSYW